MVISAAITYSTSTGAHAMQYRTLGRTGIEVSPYCLGAMMFGGMGNSDHDESIRIIHKAFDAGINFIDTADRYSQGESDAHNIRNFTPPRERASAQFQAEVPHPLGHDLSKLLAARVCEYQRSDSC
jgi:aryl-alcohol dehydrogenase (NADP+)